MYQDLVEKLIYLPPTRLDINYAVSVTNQFIHNSKKVHLQTDITTLKGHQEKELCSRIMTYCFTLCRVSYKQKIY